MSATLERPPTSAGESAPAAKPTEPVRADEGIGTQRAISLAAAVGLLWPLFQSWNGIIGDPSIGVAVIALVAGALWLVCAIATADSEAALCRLDRLLLVLGLLTLAAYAASTLHGVSTYGTDEAAFEQSAANLLIHGHDPYGANLLNSLGAFGVPNQFATYTVSGGTVSMFGYPALPLLVVAPFVWLTSGGQAVPIANIVILMVATILMYKALPRGWRGLAVVIVVGYPALFRFALAGLNATLMMAALIVVAHRWTNIGEHVSLTRADRVRAIAFGLALCTNPLAWFASPFLLSGIYLVRNGHLERRAAARVTARFAALAVATFAAVNAPFVIWGPGAWLSGVAAPLTQHAIPYGQGLVDLTVFLRVGGGAMHAYDYAAACLFVALLIVYVLRFRTLARSVFALAPIALFVSGRSLSEYWLMMIAVVLVGAVTADGHAIRRAAQPSLVRLRLPVWLPGRVALASVLLPAAICLGVALGTPAPLQLRIVSVHSDPAVFGVSELRVAVHNQSSRALRPQFATNATGQLSLWQIRSGPPQLGPGETAVYALSQRDTAAMPPNGSPFIVQAITASPETMSSTAPFTQPGQVSGNW